METEYQTFRNKYTESLVFAFGNADEANRRIVEAFSLLNTEEKASNPPIICVPCGCIFMNKKQRDREHYESEYMTLRHIKLSEPINCPQDWLAYFHRIDMIRPESGLICFPNFIGHKCVPVEEMDKAHYKVRTTYLT